MIETLIFISSVFIVLALLGYALSSPAKIATRKTQRYVRYRHHNAMNWVREDLKGQHRDYCLCYDCKNFRPKCQNNCPVAQTLYTICVDHNMVTPVWECPGFEMRD